MKFLKSLLIIFPLIVTSASCSSLYELHGYLGGDAHAREMRKTEYLKENPNITEEARQTIINDDFFEPMDLPYSRQVIGPISGTPYFVYIDEDLHSLLKEQSKFYIKNNPNLSTKIKQAMQNGSIIIGMTKEQVMFTWGAPQSTHTTISTNGKFDQWGYKIYALGITNNTRLPTNVECYFNNDKLVEIFK